mmetsp:Transcript_63092/g.100133  ORF Transcript_63092/g.100133 Transcript_63092/m.100133 type:complete len:215 (-) Transcript_63092:563-1207(-)
MRQLLHLRHGGNLPGPDPIPGVHLLAVAVQVSATAREDLHAVQHAKPLLRRQEGSSFGEGLEQRIHHGLHVFSKDTFHCLRVKHRLPPLHATKIVLHGRIGVHQVLGKDVLQGFLHLLRLVVIEASLEAACAVATCKANGQPHQEPKEAMALDQAPLDSIRLQVFRGILRRQPRSDEDGISFFQTQVLPHEIMLHQHVRVLIESHAKGQGSSSL